GAGIARIAAPVAVVVFLTRVSHQRTHILGVTDAVSIGVGQADVRGTDRAGTVTRFRDIAGTSCGSADLAGESQRAGVGAARGGCAVGQTLVTGLPGTRIDDAIPAARGAGARR